MVPSAPIIGTYHPGLESRATMFAHPDALVFDRPFSLQCYCMCRAWGAYGGPPRLRAP